MWFKKRDAAPDSNLATDVFADWKWAPTDPAKSLDTLHMACVGLAVDSVGWYNRKKRGKQLAAKWLRGLAIGFSGVGGLLLICSQQEKGLSSGWATAALVVAGTLVGIDRFFGLTNAWIRFVESAHNLRILTHQFKLDWELKKTAWQGNEPAEQQINDAVSLARKFVSTVDAVITTEINDWATQFRSNIVSHDAKLDSSGNNGDVDLKLIGSKNDIAQSSAPADGDHSPVASGD